MSFQYKESKQSEAFTFGTCLTRGICCWTVWSCITVYTSCLSSIGLFSSRTVLQIEYRSDRESNSTQNYIHVIFHGDINWWARVTDEIPQHWFPMNNNMIPQYSLPDIITSGRTLRIIHIIQPHYKVGLLFWQWFVWNGMVREMDRKLGKWMDGRIGWRNGVKNWERNGI